MVERGRIMNDCHLEKAVVDHYNDHSLPTEQRADLIQAYRQRFPNKKPLRLPRC